MMKTLIALCAFVTISYGFHAAVKQENTETWCIVLDAEAEGKIFWNDFSSNDTKEYSFQIKNISQTQGKCNGITNNATTQSITLSFYPNNVTPTVAAAAPWDLKIIFRENTAQTNNAYQIDSYELNAVLYEDLFPNATHTEIKFVPDPTGEKEWHGQQDVGFSCSKTGLAFLNGGSIEFKSMKVVAFAILDQPEFKSNQSFEQCKLDMRTSDVVPIVVGACLAGLVIIVLIAYLIGRARAKRQGYASV